MSLYQGYSAMGSISRAGFRGISQKDLERMACLVETETGCRMPPKATLVRETKQAGAVARKFAETMASQENVKRCTAVRRYFPEYLAKSLTDARVGGGWLRACASRVAEGAGFEIITEWGNTMAWAGIDGMDWFRLSADISYAGVIIPGVDRGDTDPDLGQHVSRTAALALYYAWTALRVDLAGGEEYHKSLGVARQELAPFRIRATVAGTNRRGHEIPPQMMGVLHHYGLVRHRHPTRDEVVMDGRYGILVREKSMCYSFEVKK
jgi:hypothetical protein